MPSVPLPQLLHSAMEATAARQPGAAAVYDTEGVWTYAELDAASRRYAAHLASAGVKAGDRVLIRAVAERWVLAAVYACSRTGAIAVPLNPDLRPAQWEAITTDAEPAAVLTRPPATEDLAHTRLVDAVDPGSAVVFLYTSGSTAAPKAVVCPHRQVLFAARTVAATLGYRADDVILCRLPLSFDYGLYQAFMAAITGASLVLRGPGQDSGLLAAVREHAVTVVPVVPSLAALLNQLGRRGPAPGVRLLTNTGQELTSHHIAGLRRTFPAASVRLMYGTTECKRVTIAEPDSDLVAPGSVGGPLPGTTIRVEDSDGRPVALGEEGHIVVEGPHLMDGYWKDEALTERTYRQAASTGERVLHTGDYGHLDANGNLYLHGRRDDLFKSRGVRTSVAEVEAAVLGVPDVTDAAVVPPRDGYEAVLFAVTTLPPDEVRRRLHERLEAAKVPAVCRVLSALPLGGNGKTDRTALRALVEHNERTDRRG